MKQVEQASPEAAAERERERTVRRFRRTALAIHWFVGIGGAAGGLAAVSDPVSPLGIPADALVRSPFSSFLVPGIILLGLIGGGNLAFGSAGLRQSLSAKAGTGGRARTGGRASGITGYGSGIMGGILMVWIIVQCWMLQAVAFLHVLFFLIGILQGLMGFLILRQLRLFPLPLILRLLPGCRKCRE